MVRHLDDCHQCSIVRMGHIHILPGTINLAPETIPSAHPPCLHHAIDLKKTIHSNDIEGHLYHSTASSHTLFTVGFQEGTPSLMSADSTGEYMDRLFLAIISMKSSSLKTNIARSTTRLLSTRKHSTTW